MNELIQESFALINLPLTALLGIVFVYWIFVLLGFLDISLLGGGEGDIGGKDFEVGGKDFEVAGKDVEVGGKDADLSGKGTEGGGGFGGFISSILTFMNADKLPITIVVSLFIVFMWALSLLGNYAFNPERALGPAIVILLVNWILCIFLTMLATLPLVRIAWTEKEEPTMAESLLGSVCTMLSPAGDSRLAQAEIITRGAPHRLTVRSHDGAPIDKGMEVVLIAFDAQRNLYTVKPLQEKGNAA